jgi:hypothetical protein
MPVHLAPDLKLLLQDLDAAPPRIRLMAALRGSADAALRARLEALGCQLRGQVGDVLTLECAPRTLLQLQQQPDLLSLELGGPLYPESPT